MPCGVGGGGYPPELAWWTGGLAWRGKAGWVPTGAGLVDGGGQGGGARARGGCKGFGSGGVGGRGTGPRDGANFATCVVFLLFLTRTKRRKMAFFEGCPVGWEGYPPELAWWTGGRPRALIPGQGSGKGWLGRQRLNTHPRSWWTGGQEGGARASGGCKGFGCGGVGRIFVVSNAYKNKKNGFF